MEIKIGNAVIGKIDSVKTRDKERVLSIDPAALAKDFSTWASYLPGTGIFTVELTRPAKCPVCSKLGCKEHIAVKQDCLKLKEDANGL